MASRPSKKQILTAVLQNCLIRYLISWICLQYCPRNHISISNTAKPNGIYIFLYILVFQKTHLLLKMKFRAIDLRKWPKFDIFQKSLFTTLASSTNFVLKTVPTAAG